MGLDSFLRDLLYCPYCGGRFREAEVNSAELGFGVLDCSCARFPVVAGIPVLLKDSTGKIDQVVSLIQAGRCNNALLTMLSPAASGLTPGWMRSLPSATIFRWLKKLAYERALSRWQNQTTAILSDTRLFCLPAGPTASSGRVIFHHRDSETEEANTGSGLRLWTSKL
jgi:uncharacterized protein YbaR (Trm112 family)